VALYFLLAIFRLKKHALTSTLSSFQAIECAITIIKTFIHICTSFIDVQLESIIYCVVRLRVFVRTFNKEVTEEKQRKDEEEKKAIEELKKQRTMKMTVPVQNNIAAQNQQIQPKKVEKKKDSRPLANILDMMDKRNKDLEEAIKKIDEAKMNDKSESAAEDFKLEQITKNYEKVLGRRCRPCGRRAA
jgi:hypothetical protein